MTAKITGASVPIKFTDGTIYQFSPLSDKDLDELDEWLQFKIIDVARRSLSAGATQEERDETLRIAQREACTVTFLSPRGVEIMATLAGMTHLCYVSLRKLQPDLTEEFLAPIVRDPRNLRIINETFSHTNHVPQKVKKPGAKVSSKKARHHPKTRP
jgi:hypothetical protein